MRIILAAGALVDARTPFELPPILPALEKIKLAKRLIDHGVSLNVYHPNVVGNVVVISCIDTRLWQSLKMVLYAGAEVNSLFATSEFLYYGFN